MKFLLAPTLAASVLLIAAIFGLHHNQQTLQSKNLLHMADQLGVAERLIQQWQAGHLQKVRSLSELPEVKQWANLQLQVAPGEAQITPEFRTFRTLYLGLGYQGHVLFDRNNLILDDASHGWRYEFEIPLALSQTLNDARDHGSAISLPYAAPIPLLHGEQPKGTPIQLVCTSLEAQDNSLVMCLHFDLSSGMGELLNTLNGLRGSQLYAVDAQGKQLTLQGWRQQRLTPDLGHAKSHGEHYLENYSNPNNQQVAGLLHWSEPLQLGLVIELPMQQLYAAYRQSFIWISVLTLVAVLLLFGISWLAHSHRQREEKAQALQRQVLDHLPLQVRIRDLEGNLLLENSTRLAGSGILPSTLPLAPEQPDSNLPYLSQETWKNLKAVLQHSSVQRRQLSTHNPLTDEFHAYRLLSFPIFDTDEQLMALGNLVFDETDLVRQQRDLEAFSNDLERQVEQRTAELANAKEAAESAAQAKAEFLANMSHEIRSPLNAVIGLAYLAERSRSPEQTLSYLQRILHSARHLQDVVNGVLDFSKLSAGKLALEQVPFSPEQMLENIADMLWEKAQAKQLDMVFDLDPHVPAELYGDPLRISQILLNLVDNAIKFTSTGLIAVRIRIEQLKGNRCSLCFEVQDSGIGIPADRLNQIFVPFEQLDSSVTRRFGGTGLGLPICRHLATLMDGRLEVRSELDRGSLFSFRLSLTVPAQTSDPSAQTTASGRRALLLDANLYSRQRLAKMLASLGVQVELADSAAQAAQLLQQAQHPFQLVLFDWNLPDLSPESIQDWASQQALPRDCQLILLTAHGACNQLPSGLQDSFAAVLDKPVTPHRLQEAVQRLLQEKSELSELNNRHILLVENELLNREVACELLENMGLIVTQASDGLQALHCLANDDKIELVLMDIQMPVLDGLEATRRLRRHHPRVPVIAMTANSLPGDRERCLAAGMNDYLSKPIDPQRLAMCLGHWLEASSELPNTEAKPNTLKLPVELNQEAALARLLGNQELYQRLLQRFVSDYADIDTRLSTLLAQGDNDAAAELAHSFKSVVATIGADALTLQVQNLEHHIRSGQHVQTQLRQLTQQLQQLLQQLRQHLQG